MELLKRKIEKADQFIFRNKSGVACGREQTSFNSDQIIRETEQGPMEIQRNQGVWPARLETILSTLIAEALSSGVAGGAASGGIDVAAIGGLMDTIGLPVGGLSDACSLFETWEEITWLFKENYEFRQQLFTQSESRRESEQKVTGAVTYLTNL